MLYECEQAIFMWETYYKSFNVKVCWKDLIIGIGDKHHDVVITQLAYLLSKAWILEINEKKVKDFKRYITNELNDKILQYKILDCPDIYDKLTCILSCI